MSAHLWLLFILASLPIHAAPGPNNMLALRHAMASGFWHAALAMFARLPGYGLIFLAAGLGLGAMLLAFPAAFRLLTICGALYLVWLGFQAARAAPEAMNSPSGAPDTLTAARAEFLAAIANPKAILFATAFYAQFISPDVPGYAAHFASMVAVSLSLESCFGLAYCAGGALVGAFFRQNVLAWLVRMSGGALCLMGAGLLVETVINA